MSIFPGSVSKHQRQHRISYILAPMSLALCGFMGATAIAQTQTTQPTVKLTTDPPVSQLVPFEAEATAPQSPVRLSLQAIDAKGQLLKNANIHLQILAPPKTPWLSTDFPIVEGTQLLDLTAKTPTGELQLQQMLPIRGTYKLVVNVTPAIASEPSFQQILTLPVNEHWVKYRNFGILAAILLGVGFGGGWVIGGSQKVQPGEIAPQRVRLLLSGAIVVAIATLLVVNISAELAESHPHEHSHHDHEHEHASDTSDPVVLQEGLDVRLSGDRDATVGQPANLKVQAIDTKTGLPATDVVFRISATQLEDGWVTFAYTGVPDSQGQLAWSQQFFDGAPHKITVEVAPQPQAARQFQSVRVAQSIEVEGVAPALLTRLLALAYFTGIVVLGLLLGLWLRRGQLNYERVK